MQTPASIAGHPIHPMLIVFPIGLLGFSLACDLISLFALDAGRWQLVAQYTMVGGVIGALAAAVPGSIDLCALPASGLKRIGRRHMALNLVALALYGVNIGLRYEDGDNRGAPLALSVLAVAILAVSAWLGAELVHKHGVGVAGAGDTPGSERYGSERKAGD